MKLVCLLLLIFFYNVVMQFVQVTLFVMVSEALKLDIFGFQVSGVGKLYPKPDTRHPKPTIGITVKARKYRSYPFAGPKWITTFYNFGFYSHPPQHLSHLSMIPDMVK